MAVLKNGLGWQIGSPAISYLTTAVQHCKLFENYPGIFPGDKFVVTEKLGSPLAECQDQKYTAKPKSRRKKELLLVANKEITTNLSQSSVTLNSKLGEVLS